MSYRRSCMHIALRRSISGSLLLALLGAWSPRPVVLAEQTQIPQEEYAAVVTPESWTQIGQSLGDDHRGHLSLLPL
jgi:hypothetical protein